MPEFVLKRMILNNFPQGQLEPDVADSVDFMVQQLETLNQSELASRLTLNCLESTLKPAELPFDKTKITMIDVCVLLPFNYSPHQCLDEVALPERVREELYKLYPEAKIAELRVGGNFPYVSKPDEVNLYIEVHLRGAGLLVNKPMLGEFTDKETTTTPESSQPETPSQQ